LPYAPDPAPFHAVVLRARAPEDFVRAAAVAAEQEDAAEYFLRSAAHESMASGNFTLACVGALHAAASLDSLLADFVAGLGAGILAAYLWTYHVPLAPAIGLGPPPGGRAPPAPLGLPGAGSRICAPMLAPAA
jgi:hypothetical protein